MTGIKRRTTCSTRTRRVQPDLEAAFALQMRAVGIEGFKREHRFHKTRKWRVDFAHTDLMIAVEIEGGTAIGGRHVRPAGFRADCIKYSELSMAGWMLLRGDSKMVKSGQLLEMLERAIETAKLRIRNSRDDRRQKGGQKAIERSPGKSEHEGQAVKEGLRTSTGNHAKTDRKRRLPKTNVDKL